MEEYKIDLQKIKPKNIKKSDKYSKQIYAYLKQNPGRRNVYWQTQGDTENFKFDVGKINLHYLYFSNENSVDSERNEISGKCLRPVIGDGRDKYENFCYIVNSDTKFVDVTKAFFEEYIRIGRCIYDDHFCLADEEDRYTYFDAKTRVCNWCGKKQSLEEVTYTRATWKDVL